MNNATSETTKKQFNGFRAYFDKEPVFVVNNGGVNKDGEKLLKVKFARLVGRNGWSGGDYPIYDYPYPAIWVLASRVRTRKQLQATMSEPITW